MTCRGCQAAPSKLCAVHALTHNFDEAFDADLEVVHLRVENAELRSALFDAAREIAHLRHRIELACDIYEALQDDINYLMAKSKHMADDVLRFLGEDLEVAAYAPKGDLTAIGIGDETKL